MMYSIKWEERALREIEKLEKVIYSRIFKKIDELKYGFDSSDIKKMQGGEKYRLRIGDYRVIFSIKKETIIIWKVEHRKNIYNKI